MINLFLYGIKYVINHQVTKKETPLICGIVMHNQCNLRCRHCRITCREVLSVSYEEAKTVMHAFYKEGGRTLYLQGGEPFTWHDQDFSLEDVVNYSHKIGFLTTIIYTNGTRPLRIPP